MALERIQKILSERGVASRREAEKLIESGYVRVNGRPVKLGDKADDRRDLITVHGKRIPEAEMPLYLMLNKPRGYVTTLKDEQGRKCVADLVAKAGARVYPVGRLDKDSEGLLLMTNDGDFANAISHPRRHIAKRYRVTVADRPAEERLQQMRDGVMLDGRPTAPAEIVVLTEKEDRTVLEFVLYEGRNREIRRMCETVGLSVMRLKRIGIGSVKLGMLKIGDWRPLRPDEVRALLVETQTPDKIAAKYIKKK